MKPFATMLSFAERMIAPCGQRIERQLSHMRGMYQDIAETEAILEPDDPLEESGFLRVVVERDGQPVLIPNPRYR